MLRKLLLIVTLCAANLFVHTSGARAQCAAGDALRNPRTATAPSPHFRVDDAHKAWKTITLGTFANSFALRNALDDAGCGVGDLAEEILARPAFTMSTTKMDVDLIVVSAAELGVQTETTSLADIYARAHKVGLMIAPAEVGPQLRLHYLDQPIGEFLHVGMKPINTWTGDPVIFVLANGGAGLILIGSDGSAKAEIRATSRYLFMRPRELARKP
jgi:hypothetical protein